MHMDGEIKSGTRNLMIFSGMLIFLGGAAILGGSLYTAVTIRAFQDILSSAQAIFSVVFFLIAVGVVMVLASFFGCVGVLAERKFWLMTYAALIVVIILAEVTGSALIFVYYPLARNEAQNSIRFYNNSTMIADAWNSLQGVLECCGIHNHEDWRGGTDFPALPFSCCSDRFRGCSDNSDTLYQIGCDVKLAPYFQVVGGVGLGVLLFQIITLSAIGVGLRQLAH